MCMSLHNMNNQRMVPRKDYTANRLVSGTLQLANNTFLFLDETQLEQGQLDATGEKTVSQYWLLNCKSSGICILHLSNEQAF